MKLFLITLADWIDDNIIRHRLYGKHGGLCYLIAMSNWWGKDENGETPREAAKRMGTKDV